MIKQKVLFYNFKKYMNEKILYEKVGQEYIPIKQEYKYNSLEKGHWLVNVQPDSISLRYKLNSDAEYFDLTTILEGYRDKIILVLIERLKEKLLNKINESKY